MSAAGQPWMKFYPADWRADPALRMCSIGARGAWMEMICLMHEAEPRGSLLVAGKQVTDAQLAALIGVSKKLMTSLIAELEQALVFSRDEDGTIFSRRMRRDVQKAERDKANGKAGGNPNLKRGVNPPDKAQKPEARDLLFEKKHARRAMRSKSSSGRGTRTRSAKLTPSERSKRCGASLKVTCSASWTAFSGMFRTSRLNAPG